MTPTVAAIVNRWEGTSSSRTVMLRLMDVLDDSPVRHDDIADILRSDVALTARLLRVVNSTVFHRTDPIPTVEQAFAKFGIDYVTRLIYSTCAKSLLQSSPDEFDQARFWQHSLACAVGASELARLAGAESTDAAFVAGLLHDFGHVAVYAAFPDQARTASTHAATASKLRYHAERELWGFDHAVVGRALMGSWKLPDEVLEAVALHHTPEASTRFPISTAAVHVSDALVHALLIGGGVETCVPPVSTFAWGTLGLSIGDIPAVLEDIRDDFSRLALVLE